MIEPITTYYQVRGEHCGVTFYLSRVAGVCQDPSYADKWPEDMTNMEKSLAMGRAEKQLLTNVRIVRVTRRRKERV